MTLQGESLALLQLSMVPGLGPTLVQRAAEYFGSYAAVLTASEHSLRALKGIGDQKARAIYGGLAGARDAASREIDLAASLNVRLVTLADAAYPAILKQIPDPPLVLSVLGSFDPHVADRHGIAIVGSRECTMYGLEQAARFAGALGQSGLTIISGGARGIDTAAHRAGLVAAPAGVRTIAVLGCGLAHRYPPDNSRLFDQIVESGAGCLVSELPLGTPPSAENFPSRNRIISGLSLGVLIIEAAKRSGALITARVAVEDHNREVFVIPGRIDSPHSAGCLELLKSGAAALVTHPDDVLRELESPARHLFDGTHEARFGPGRGPQSMTLRREIEPTDSTDPGGAAPSSIRDASLSEQQRRILIELAEPQTLDQLMQRLGMDASAIRADVSVLEIKRRIVRRGSLLAVVRV